MNNFVKLKPAVSKTGLHLLAGIMWLGVGVMLCWLAYGWLSVVPSATALGLALTGILLAFVISFLGFSKLANKNILRIETLDQEKICLFAFQEWTSYPLIIVMISLGIFLRKYSPVPKPILAVVYIGIGAGLFIAGCQYFIHISQQDEIN
jgi:hypothetical protein